MSSYRNQINEAIKTQLTGKTIAGDSVFTSLTRRIDPTRDLPAIMIYTIGSVRGAKDYGNTIIPRMVTVAIEAAVSTTEATALEQAQDFADAIEQAMEADLTLGHVVNDVVWRRTMSDATSHGSTILGVCILEYDVEIMTNLKPDSAYEFGEDGFTEPPGLIFSETEILPPDFPAKPQKPADTACGPDGCDLPAWGGEQ